MGFIYCITFPSKKKYIGQTRQTIETRVRQHKCSKDETLIARAFQKYTDFTVEILVEVNNEMLDSYETKFIDMFDTISPNGYNLRSGGQNGYYFSDDVRQKCSDKARKNGIDKNLPMYVYQTNNGYRCRPPGKAEKYFCYKILSDEVNLQLAIEYIEGKTELYDEYLKPKELPKFICKVERKDRSGYRCTLPNYERHFTSMKLTDEQKYNNATQYLQSILKKVQRLNVSGQQYTLLKI